MYGAGVQPPEVATTPMSLEPPPQSPPVWKTAAWIRAGVGLAWLIKKATLTKREKHDRKAERMATKLLRDGYCVIADIAGWLKPPITNSHRADVYTDGVDVSFSSRSDIATHWSRPHTHKQIADLNRHCEAQPCHTFKVRLTQEYH